MKPVLRLLLMLAALLSGQGAGAQERVIVGLSQNRIAITANFDGSELLIFGAVQRYAPPPDAGPLEVIVTITGPTQPVTVRRKERIVGIWANTDSISVDKAPSFYTVVSSGRLAELLTGPEDHRYGISVERRIRSVSVPEGIDDRDAFIEGLLRVRAAQGLYRTIDNAVDLNDETLFRTRIALPSNLVEGDYQARIFLLRDQRVVDSEASIVSVNKVGLERWLYLLALNQPLIYGLLSVTLAVLLGWAAAALLGRARG